MSKIVVFGGDGFIGRHLVKQLAVNNKNDEIYAFDRFSSYKTNSEHPFDKIDNIRIVQGDFFNRDEMDNVIKEATYVFHLVTSTTPATSQNDPFIDIDTNIRSSVELFQLCTEHRVKKIIFFSSGGTVYGNIDSKVISENTTPHPLSPHAIGKLTIEHYLRYFKNTHDLDYVIYRIANPYGPGQNIYGKQGVMPIFMHRYVTHEPITIYGDGSMMRDYIYIDDLISMIVGTFEKNNSSEVYNLGSGKGVTINELTSAIEKCSQYSVDKKHIESPSTYIQNSVLDTSLFNNDFGIVPLISLNEGIKRTWDYVKEIK